MHFFLIKAIDVVSGDAVFISDYRISQRFLSFREFVVNGNKDDWLIALKLDYEHEVKIVNKNYPKHKQIVKLINMSLEHGIESKWDKLYKHGMLMLLYLFENLVDLLTALRNQIEKRRNQIPFEELSNVFLCFIISLPISIIVFIIELIYYKFKLCKIFKFKPYKIVC